MDKEFWKHVYLNEGYKPVLTCPTCDKGLLTLAKDNIKYFETAESIRNQDDPAFEDFWVQYKFSAILICNNPNCKDIVATAGTGGMEGEYAEDDDGYPHNVWKLYLKPNYFEPPLKIIPLKNEYPEKIQNLLTESFSVFFLDSAACANKIRQVVEQLLTLKKIPRFTVNVNKKLKDINLHSRIDMFKKQYAKYSDIADQLIAIKWIGNTGSHSGTIKKESILDAYSILQNCLDLIYIQHDHQAKIKRLAKKITKRKGK